MTPEREALIREAYLNLTPVQMARLRSHGWVYVRVAIPPPLPPLDAVPVLSDTAGLTYADLMFRRERWEFTAAWRIVCEGITLERGHA